MKSSVLAIPFMILVATFPPRKNAPENSIIAATTIADRRDKAPEPTEVAKAFATSFAPTHYTNLQNEPIPKAQKKANTPQHQGTQVYSTKAVVSIVIK